MVVQDIYSVTSAGEISSLLGISKEIALVLIIIIGIWSLVWKGFALWKAATKKQKIWFVALLIINSIGILEILYIYIFSEMKFNFKKSEQKIKSNIKKKR